MKEYYDILGITDIENATKETVRKAFLKKAKKVHPDHNQSNEAGEEFKKLYKAYETIMKHFDNDKSNNDWNTNFDENGNFKKETPQSNYSNFMFFDKDLQYWLTKIFGKVMPSFVQQGYEPTGIFGPPYK